MALLIPPPKSHFTEADDGAQELKNDNRQRDGERLFFICVIDELIMLLGLIRESFQSLFVRAGLEINSSHSHPLQSHSVSFLCLSVSLSFIKVII